MKAPAPHPGHRQSRPVRPAAVQRVRHLCGVLAALSLLLVSTTAQAEPGLGRGAEPAQALPTQSGEVVAARAPRWQGPDAPPRASLEVDTRKPSGPWDDGASWRLRYVRWAPAGSAAVGVSMGVAGSQQAGLQPPPMALAEPRPQPALVPEVGVRWRSSWQSNRRVDVGAFSSYDGSKATPDDERRLYNARVELQFRENRNKFGFDIGQKAFGLQLSGNSRLMLRAKHGGPMVYYRSTW